MKTYKFTIESDGTKTFRNEAGDLDSPDNDTPAVEWADGSKDYYQNGERHRDGDKPAIECADGRKYYYKNGVWYDPFSPKAKELSVAEISKLLGYEVKIIK